MRNSAATEPPVSDLTVIERAGRLWFWPADDTKLIQVFDYHQDIQHILRWVDTFGVCVQAGGACGVWPYYLAREFGAVYTFEPHPINFQCLATNAKAAVKFQAALDSMTGLQMGLSLHPQEEGNAGAWYVDNNGASDCFTLAVDDLYLQHCDLIQLDVEGHEYDALMGAAQTIRRHRPTIVIEEKELPQGLVGDAPDLLRRWGYKVASKVHRDVIYTPCAR